MEIGECSFASLLCFVPLQGGFMKSCNKLSSKEVGSRLL